MVLDTIHISAPYTAESCTSVDGDNDALTRLRRVVRSELCRDLHMRAAAVRPRALCCWSTASRAQALNAATRFRQRERGDCRWCFRAGPAPMAVTVSDFA